MCPGCGEPLIIFELEGIEIDHCVSCLGTWLDSGELEMLTERAGAEAGRLSQALAEAKSGRKTERRCPRCQRRLRLKYLKGSETIELDECPVGHGMWFDHGEMKRSIEAFDEGEEGAVAAFFSDLFRAELES